jgi:hypothetical protein
MSSYMNDPTPASAGGGAPAGGYWKNGQFISSDPGSAFYKSPAQLANEAAGKDQFGQNPANIGNPSTGWYNSQGEWVAPYKAGTANKWAPPVIAGEVYPDEGRKLLRAYDNPLFKSGWYRPSAMDEAKGGTYAGSPQTYEEAEAIQNYYNETGLKPTSEWVQSYMDSKYPNSNALSFFPGSTPWEIGQRRQGNELTRNAQGIMQGPYLDQNRAEANRIVASRQPGYEEPEVAVPSKDQLLQSYNEKLQDYYVSLFNNEMANNAQLKSLDIEDAYLSESQGKTTDEKELADIQKQLVNNAIKREQVKAGIEAGVQSDVDAANNTIETLLTSGQPITAFPRYKEMVNLYGDLFDINTYLKKEAERGQRLTQQKALAEERNQPYGSNPIGATMQTPEPYQEVYSRYVNALPVGQSAKNWLHEQYPVLYREWESNGQQNDFTTYVRGRLQSSVSQYESRFGQNPRYAPITQEAFIPNVR